MINASGKAALAGFVKIMSCSVGCFLPTGVLACSPTVGFPTWLTEDIRNNVNPFLAHYRVPKWETTSTMYGEHYRHPEQTYTRPMKNRMPVFHINL